MAKRIATQFIDDFDGTDAEGTVTFSDDSKLYEIDLSAKNKKKLEEALEPFIKAGRTTGGSRRAFSGLKSNPKGLLHG